MRVAAFDGLSDQRLIALFQTERKAEYDALEAQATAFEQQILRHWNQPRAIVSWRSSKNSGAGMLRSPGSITSTARS